MARQPWFTALFWTQNKTQFKSLKDIRLKNPNVGFDPPVDKHRSKKNMIPKLFNFKDKNIITLYDQYRINAEDGLRKSARLFLARLTSSWDERRSS